MELPSLMLDRFNNLATNAKVAEQLNKQPPQPRHRVDRQQVSQWQAAVVQRRMANAGGFTSDQWKSKVIAGDSYCCTKPLASLKPITLRDMRIPMLHTDRFLACRTVVDGIVAIGTSCLVEDLNGDIERITIYNVRDPNQLEWLHANTTLILKEPYLHYSSHTGVPSLRVDSLSDIIFADETDKALLEFAGAIKCKGTLLLVSKAFTMSYADEYVPMVFTVNVITGVPRWKTQSLNIIKTIRTLQRNPQRAEELYSLYAGQISRDEAIPEGVIDAARIEQICIFNSYGAQNMFDRLNLEVGEEGIIEKTPCGLWTLPSLINHYCLANAYRVYYGDVMAVHAIADVKTGEEISLSYADPTQAYDSRTKQLKGFGIECSCRLCETERADANRFEREKLLKQSTVLAGSSQSPAGKLAQMKLVVKKIRKTYRNHKDLQTQLFLPLY